jgi:hypothetical protein
VCPFAIGKLRRLRLPLPPGDTRYSTAIGISRSGIT